MSGDKNRPLETRGAPLPPQEAFIDLLRRVMGFAVVSGAGLALDFGVFLALTHGAHLQPGIANLVSSGLAVALVFFTSVHRIFRYQGGLLFARFATYVVYQAIGVSLCSLAIDALVAAGWLPLVAKLAILPVSFSANFLFMHALTAFRRGGQAEAGR